MPLFSHPVRRPYVIGELGTRSYRFALCEWSGKALMISSLHADELAVSSFPRDFVDKAFSAIVQTFPRVQDLVLSLPADVLKASLHTISFQRPHPEKSVDGTEEKTLEQKFQREAEQAMKEKIAGSSGILGDDLRTLHLGILTRSIEGYSVSQWRALRGKRVSATILGVFLTESYHQMLQSIARQSRKIRLAIRHVGQGVQAFADMTSAADGVYLDITDTATHAFVIKHGRFVALDELRLGGEDFTRLLSSSLGMSENIAEEFKRRYGEGKLSNELREKVRALFHPLMKEFVEHFQAKLEQARLVLPPQIFLFGKDSVVPEIRESLSNMDIRSVPFPGIPRVELLLPTVLKLVQTDHPIKDPQYTSLFFLGYAVANKPLS